ncbi:MAG: class I SAM-dependent methyltransferase [Bacteroidota bacterium]|nr:class I SAM-dependent methyltransferase [Bacteroidota bacterium]
MDSTTENIEAAQKAFSAQAPSFDSYEKKNKILQWMRKQVYKHEEEFLHPNDTILELNAGTGIDAVHFAQQGHSVFAIDNADGMLNELQKKIDEYRLEDKIRYAKCSFTELSSLPPQRFSHIFSNFGGLNCIPDLRIVTEQLHNFSKPGGTITFVIMPKVCPWEMLHVLKGNTRLAFRRFTKNGTVANIEGHLFQTYYFSPHDVVTGFGSRYTVVKIRGLASLSPPPYMETFPEKFPNFYKALTRFDERFSIFAPLNKWGDHFIITMKLTK